jgi:hypothetical protein
MYNSRIAGYIFKILFLFWHHCPDLKEVFNNSQERNSCTKRDQIFDKDTIFQVNGLVEKLIIFLI